MFFLVLLVFVVCYVHVGVYVECVVCGMGNPMVLVVVLIVVWGVMVVVMVLVIGTVVIGDACVGVRGLI